MFFFGISVSNCQIRITVLNYTVVFWQSEIILRRPLMNWPITNFDIWKQKLHNLTNASAHKLSEFLMQALENKQGKNLIKNSSCCRLYRILAAALRTIFWKKELYPNFFLVLSYKFRYNLDKIEIKSVLSYKDEPKGILAAATRTI